MELEKKKKLYAEDDISKLAVLKSNNDTVASKVGQNLRSSHCSMTPWPVRWVRT
jgi:hypothetical protein